LRSFQNFEELRGEMGEENVYAEGNENFET
jgi:hypothetical protein